MENALDVMKDLVNEFIIEQENEDKLNNEIDALLDGVDFSKPLSPMEHVNSKGGISPSTVNYS